MIERLCQLRFGVLTRLVAGVPRPSDLRLTAGLGRGPDPAGRTPAIQRIQNTVSLRFRRFDRPVSILFGPFARLIEFSQSRAPGNASLADIAALFS